MSLKRTVLCLTLALAGGMTGCTEKDDPAREVNFYNAGDRDIRGISRVVFVELHDHPGYPEVTERMTRALAEAMLRRGLFRVDVLPVDHPDLRYLEMLGKREAYSIAELAEIRKRLRCDAVLFGQVTSYKPYPSTQIGLFLRLIDLQDGKLAWAVDDVWDTTQRETVRQIKNYYFDRMADDYQPANYEMGIMSTTGFQKYVASEVTKTMDPQYQGESRKERYFIRPIRKFGRSQKEFWANTKEDL